MNRSTGRFLATLRLLAVRRFAILAALGFVSGLPLLLTGGTLTYWFAREGIDKTTIGLFAIIAIPYTLKFLWAPLLDYFSPPPIIRRLGRRRGWAMSIVLPLAACLFAIGLCDPHSQLLLIALLGMMVAACSASLDIVLDALRIESLSDDEQAMGSALFIYGYRVAILVAGAGAFSLADYLAWSVIYSAMAGLMLVSSLIILMAFEPATSQSKAEEEASLIYRICCAFLDPFIEFFQRLGLSTIAILVLVILYKFGDAVLGQMANPFYHEMGYSGTEIGLVTKFWGLWATMIGIGAGGVLAIRIGLFHALVVAGIAQALTNLAFVWIAAGGDPLTAQLFQYVGGQEAGDTIRLAVAITADNFAGGMATVALVALLGALCNREFTAAHYALLSSMSAFGRTVLSSGSGWLVDQTGWIDFFLLTIMLAVPGLLLLYWLRRHGIKPFAPG